MLGKELHKDYPCFTFEQNSQTMPQTEAQGFLTVLELKLQLQTYLIPTKSGRGNVAEPGSTMGNSFSAHPGSVTLL